MHRGYVKLWRCVEDTGLMGQPSAFYLYTYFLLKATHKPKSFVVGGAVFDLQPGQVIVGRNKLSDDTGLSVQQIRTALELLKKLSIISCRVTNKCTVISINNWDIYQQQQPASNHQDNQQSNQYLTNDQPAPNQHLTTIQEYKNIRTEECKKKETHTVAPKASTGELSLFDMSSASPSVCDSSPIGEKKGSSKVKSAGYSEDFERFWKAYPKRVNKGQAWKTWEKLRKAKELPEIEELCRAVRWRKISDDWEKDDGRFIPHPSTWLNAHGWEDEACKEPPDDPRNDPREEEAYRIANSMGGFMPLREECRNTRLYWERMVRINEALEDAGYGEFGTNKELIAMNLGENK